MDHRFNHYMQSYINSGSPEATNELEPYRGIQSEEAADITGDTDLFEYLKTWDDMKQCEDRGFYGFASTGEVIDYLHIKDHMLLDSVILVETPDAYNMARVNAGSREAFLEIPTFSGASVLAVLPEQSPHAKNVVSFAAGYEERAAEAASFELPILGFAEWWIIQGGKFHMIGMKQASLQPQPLNGPAPEFQGSVHPYSSQSTPSDSTSLNMVQNVDTEMLSDPALTNVQVVQQKAHTPNPRAAARDRDFGGPSTTKLGHYTNRTFPPGAFRIWEEIGVKLPPHVARTHSAEHPIFGRAAFYTVDLRLLGDLYVTALELLTWFPEHMVYWPDFVYRFAGAGWIHSDMIKYYYIVHGMDSMSGLDIQRMAERDRSRLNHYRARLGLTQQDAPILHPYTDFTCSNWQLPQADKRIMRGLKFQNTFIDYYVSDIGDGIPPAMFPTGENAGPLTAALEIVRDNPDDPVCQSLKLSGVSQFVKDMGLFRTAEQAGLQTSPPPGVRHADSTASYVASAFIRQPQYNLSISSTYRRIARIQKAQNQSIPAQALAQDSSIGGPSGH
jgi:hypothetical protein